MTELVRSRAFWLGWDVGHGHDDVDRRLGGVAVSDQAPSSGVLRMLTAAEQITDGLADLALAIYDADPRFKDQLAAANAASTHMQDARREAERMLWEKAEVN